MYSTPDRHEKKLQKFSRSLLECSVRDLLSAALHSKGSIYKQLQAAVNYTNLFNICFERTLWYLVNILL